MDDNQESGSSGLTIARQETVPVISGHRVKETVEAILKEKLPHLACKVISDNRIHVEGKGTFVWPPSISADRFIQIFMEKETGMQRDIFISGAEKPKQETK